MLRVSYCDHPLSFAITLLTGVVGCGEGVMYLMSLGRPTDIGLQLGKAYSR